MNHIILIDTKTNYTLYKLECQEFKINNPKSDEELIFIETSTLNKGFEWIPKINEQILNKKGVTKEKIINAIEKKYSKILEERKQNMENKASKSIAQLENEIKEQIYKNTIYDNINKKKSKINFNSNEQNIFKTNVAGEMLFNEYFNLKNKIASLAFLKEKNIELSLDDNNIYCWNLKIFRFENKELNKQLDLIRDKFGYHFIEIELNFHDTLYPTIPPQIQIIKPFLDNLLFLQISNLKMLKMEYWQPTRTTEFIINKLVNILEKHASIRVEGQFKFWSDDEIILKELYNKIIQLSTIICDIKEDTIDDENYISNKQFEIKNIQKRNVVWNAGVGYGYSNSNTEWNPQSYITFHQEKNKQLLHVFKNVNEILKKYIIDENESTFDKKSENVINLIISVKLLDDLMKILNNETFVEINNNKEKFQEILYLLNFITNFYIKYNNESKNKMNDIHYNNLINIKNTLENLSNKLKDYEKIVSIKNDNFYNVIKILCKKSENIEIHMQIDQQIEIPNDIKQEYILRMKEKIFDDAKLNNFSYQKLGSLNGLGINRVASEVVSFANNLPIFYESSIFVRIDTESCQKLRILITGPKDTPYDSGIFIFDMGIDSEFPSKPPLMTFCNNGKKRFNPNLYNCGKVCLSLLNTWNGAQGEKWNPQTSTLLQILVSIQSQILVENPFYNEPGYESSYNTTSGKMQSEEYNQNIQYYTMLHSMFETLSKNEYPEFRDVILMHFKMKKDYIIEILNKWVDPNQKNEARLSIKNQLINLLNQTFP